MEGRYLAGTTEGVRGRESQHTLVISGARSSSPQNGHRMAVAHPALPQVPQARRMWFPDLIVGRARSEVPRARMARWGTGMGNTRWGHGQWDDAGQSVDDNAKLLIE